jgi:CubicO group peptidase (beta-lactamase class C family)
MTAACVRQPADQGLPDLDRNVSHYRPEFGCSGKAEICVRHWPSRRAGHPAVDEKLPAEAIIGWGAKTPARADQGLLWQPGLKHGYHTRTHGWLLGEVGRRVLENGRGICFLDEIAGLLAFDFHIGLSDEPHERVDSIRPVTPPLLFVQASFY